MDFTNSFFTFNLSRSRKMAGDRQRGKNKSVKDRTGFQQLCLPNGGSVLRVLARIDRSIVRAALARPGRSRRFDSFISGGPSSRLVSTPRKIRKQRALELFSSRLIPFPPPPSSSGEFDFFPLALCSSSPRCTSIADTARNVCQGNPSANERISNVPCH